MDLPAKTAETATADIQIEVQSAGSRIKITWPGATARDCAIWLSDWLR